MCVCVVYVFVRVCPCVSIHKDLFMVVCMPMLCIDKDLFMVVSYIFSEFN